MIITLLGLILLVSLVLFTLNMGQHVDRRVNAQTGADATAIAGATWVARSLNLVAMDNLAMSRDIALVCVMDSMPVSTHFAFVEQSAMRDALQAQISRGLNRNGPAPLTTQLNSIMAGFLSDLQEEVDLIQPADQFFQQYDLTPITWYNPTSGSGHGALWREMAALDEMNQATLESLGVIAQTTAVVAGHATQGNEQNADAFVAPLAPAVAYQHGDFNDFERPVKYGLLPTAVDDEVQNRGPYDTVFGFHALIRSGSFTPGDSDVAQGGHGNVPLGSGTGSMGTWTAGPPTGYHTWGSFGELLDNVGGYTAAHVPNSRLSWWTNMLSLAKLYYLWPDGAPYLSESRANWPPHDVYEPQWITDYTQALSQAAGGNVHETAFFVVEFKSRYPIDSPNFMSAGSWSLVTDNSLQQPRIARTTGWTDPRTWNATQVADYGWRDTWQYTAWYDNTIGLTPLTDADGNPIAQPIYRVDFYYFAGVNIGPLYSTPDPFRGFDPSASTAPSPTDLNHDLVKRNSSCRRQYLTYLGIAAQDRIAPTWHTQFNGTSPTPFMLTMAQAQVFNNHSWDLWTPMWRAQLQPIADVTAWAQTMTVPSHVSTELNTQTIATAQQYLNAVAPLGDLMTSH